MVRHGPLVRGGLVGRGRLAHRTDRAAESEGEPEERRKSCDEPDDFRGSGHDEAASE